MSERRGQPEFNPENSNKKEEINKSRRSFLGHIIGATIGVGVGKYFGEKTYEALAGEDDNKTEAREAGVEPLKSFKEFQNFGDGVLVICANQAEKRSVKDFLEKHNTDRTPTAKFRIQSEGNIIWANIPVKKFEDRDLRPGVFSNGPEMVKVQVVSFG